jgi:hypothetical protein
MEHLYHPRIIRLGQVYTVIDELNGIDSCQRKFQKMQGLIEAQLTLSENANSLTEIARLAVRPFRVLQHAIDESKLTEKTVLARTACGDV